MQWGLDYDVRRASDVVGFSRVNVFSDLVCVSRMPLFVQDADGFRIFKRNTVVNLYGNLLHTPYIAEGLAMKGEKMYKPAKMLNRKILCGIMGVAMG